MNKNQTIRNGHLVWMMNSVSEISFNDLWVHKEPALQLQTFQVVSVKYHADKTTVVVENIKHPHCPHKEVDIKDFFKTFYKIVQE